MYKKIIVFISFLVLTICCETWDIRLNINNNTDTTFYFVISRDENFKENAFNTPFSENLDSKDYVRRLSPQSSKKVKNFGRNSWVKYVEKSKTKSLNIYFFTEDVILNNSWKYIYENKLYISYYKYDLNELEKINWNIEFNPH